MKHVGVALFVMACWLPLTVHAQGGPYLDPSLRMLMQPAVAQAIEAAPRLGGDVAGAAQPLSGRIALLRASPAERPRVEALVRVRGAAGLGELRALGATIGSERDGIATVQIPVDALARLAAATSIAVVESSHTMTVSHDSSMLAIRADQVRAVSNGVWTGATGRNVIVGVYDTGIDFHHADFRTPTGQTRVVALWDQTQAGTPPAGYNQGHLCTRDAIQRVIDAPLDFSPCRQIDFNGHGSHTAGTAAGNGAGGSGTPFQYAGVAPNAELMIVKGGNGTFTEGNILDGLRWMEAESRRLGRPMVVNMSLGNQAGPHDGTRLFEQGIDALSRPGFIIVISSGNEGSNGNIRNRDGTPFTFTNVFFHGGGNVVTGQTREFTINVPSYTPLAPRCNESVGLSFWYEGADRVTITVVRPNGTSHSVNTGQTSSQDNLQGNISIDNASTGPNPQNGDNEAFIQINDCGLSSANPAGGTYTLRVTTIGTGSGAPFHFWMVANFLGIGSIARGAIGFDNRYIVGSPGVVGSAVTVGAFSTRMCWPRTGGQTCFTQVEASGDLARFSSGGPSRDDRIKPEITAPGMAVVSVLSANSAPASDRITPDRAHVANQGTSMAAPHVTGAIALMLEANPQLSPVQVKQIFSRSATRDGFTSRTYSSDLASRPQDWWGYGKLNVQRALCETGSTLLGQMVSITPVRDSLPANATLQLDACAAGVSTVVYASSDASTATVDANGLIRALRPGSVLIIARAGALADTARIEVVPASTLSPSAISVAPTEPVVAAAGTLLSLLAVDLQNTGGEDVRVESFRLLLSGRDPVARVIVAEDLNANRRLDASDRTIASVLRGTADTMQIATPVLVLQRRATIKLIVGLQLSGNATNYTSFRVQLMPEQTRSVGLRSGLRDLIEPVSLPLLSASALTTVLAGAEFFSISENPVRSNRVVFNFRETPTTAGIYTVTGRRVRNLIALLDESGAIDWNLANDDGTTIAPGVYLLVFNLGTRQVREKLFVLTPRH